MKRVVSIVCVAALLLSVLALAGCGLSGNYKLVEASSGGVTMDPSALGMESIQLTISGKTAILSSGSDSTNLTVDTKAKVFISADGSESVPYRTEGKRLIIEKDGLSMVFEKQ